MNQITILDQMIVGNIITKVFCR